MSFLSTSAFEAIPLEILKEILCNVDSEYLPDMKLVCTRWRKIITDILNIKELPETKTKDALCIFEHWVNRSNGTTYFWEFEAPSSVRNLISKPTMSQLLEDPIEKLKEVDYVEALEALKWHAERGGAWADGCEDVYGSIWRTVLAMTGIEGSVEKLSELTFTDDAVKSLMTGYRWYEYISESMPDYFWDAGLIALYPDNKKFSIIMAYDID